MPSGIGYGAAEGLEDVIARMYLRQQLEQQQTRDTNAADYQRRYLDVSEGNLRQRQAEFNAEREAAAAAARAKDAAAAQKQAALSQLLPQYLDALTGGAPPEMVGAYRDQLKNTAGFETTAPPAQRVARLVGINTVQGGKPVRVFRREDSIGEGEAFPVYQKPETPPTARIVQDDPTYPRGVQAYTVQLRSSHPSFDSALAEAQSALPKLLREHPNLSPQKFVNALRQAYTGSGGGGLGSGVSAEIQAAVSGRLRGGGAPAGGRGANPSTAAGVPNSPGVPEAQLEQRAAEVLRSLGKDTSPASVQRFLSNPENRRRLMTGGGR